MLVVIYYFLAIAPLCYYIYMAVTGFIGILKKPTLFQKSETFHHFACIIPARNEEAVICSLIDSLKRQDYPKDKYEIIVIPNNCADRTSDICIREGVEVLPIDIPVKSKGDVLAWTVEHLKNRKEIDAYAVFDADNVVDSHFLTVMNTALAGGYDVCQGYTASKNKCYNLISGSYDCYYMMQNIMFNRSRMNLGASAVINGSGFVLQKDFADENGLRAVSLTEDVELAGQCAIAEKRIAFVEDAVTYDEQPSELGRCWNQLRRWTSGLLVCAGHYFPALIKCAVKKRSLAALDIAIIYITPVLLVLSAIIIGTPIALKLTGVSLTGIPDDLWWFNFLLVCFLYVAVEAMIIMERKKRFKTDKNRMKGVLSFGLFLIVLVAACAFSLFKKEKRWKMIEHNQNVTIDEIENKA